MSEFRLVKLAFEGTADTPPMTTADGIWELSRDEAATLWYALSAYKTQLIKDATSKDNPPTIEDEMFLLTTAGAVAKLQFELRDNHSPTSHAEAVRTWLDTE